MTTGEHKYLSDFARKYYGEGRSAGRAEGVAEGKAEGVRQALLTVTTARAIPLTDQHRATLAACTDLSTLERWLARAIHATAAGDVFED